MIKISEDLKACDATTACQILEENAEDAWWFLQKNEEVYKHFCEVQIENDYSIAEYIWYYHWEEYIDFLLMEY